MPVYFIFICIFIKSILTSLSPPQDPYSGDMDQNYLYEQACYRSASEHSIRYENLIVQSKMFQAFYSECLATIWPKCEVVDAKGLMVNGDPYKTFKAKDVIAHDMMGKSSMKARKPGFCVEKLLDPNDRGFIFWNSSKPKTDIERFNKIKFASTKELYDMHLKNITSCIRKFQNAGIEESPEKLCITKELPSGKHIPLLDFEKFKTAVKNSLEMVKTVGRSPQLAKGNYGYLRFLLRHHLPTDLILTHSYSKQRPGERLHLFHPLYTVIKPGFPTVAYYMPSGMRPILRPCLQWSRSFVVAVFDENGNFMEDPKKDFASYLTIAFRSIKREQILA